MDPLSAPVLIVPASVDEPDVAALIARHFALMRKQSPPESCHVFSAQELAAPGIRLYALRQAGQAVAIGALHIDGGTAEIKSMHTAAEARGQGVARVLLQFLIDEAAALGVRVVQLETGSQSEHTAARRLYHAAGFADCPPFGSYVQDPLSVFMRKGL